MASPSSDSSSPAAQPPDNGRLSPARRRTLVFAVVLAAVVASAFGFRELRFILSHEETDDAQVEGDISPVLPRVSGYVARILARDNQRVAVGQSLLEIDPAELDLRVTEAEAAARNAQASLAAARAGLASAQAAAAVARAEVVEARVQRDHTASDWARDQRLFAGAAVTERQLSDSKAAAEAAAARWEASERRAQAARASAAEAATRIDAAAAEAAEKASALDYAKLERSYATVAAPIAGLVSRKSVEPGQFVQEGQTLLSIVSDTNAWVVANFKETQMARMQPGQSAAFTVASYPGLVFHGQVQSIAGATGARFALLPPDNATGNFVKVTQRVPVKIVPTDAPDPLHPLRPGLSVDAIVQVGS